MLISKGRIKDDLNMLEFVRCCLADIVIGVFAPTELYGDLSAFRRQTADFLTDKPLDLRLHIIKPQGQFFENGYHKGDMFTNSLLLNGDQAGWAKVREDLFGSSKQNLNRLLSNAAFYDRFKGFAAADTKLSLVPLAAGFLCADLENKKALLILGNGQTNQSSYQDFSRLAHFSMAALNALMAYLALYMAQRGEGVVAHGAGMHYKGSGYLFLAPSGGGKTTLSKNSLPGSVLADDGIIIRRNNERYRLYPTPFRQGLGGHRTRRDWHRSALVLRAAFMLDQGAQTRIKPAKRRKILGRLITAMTHFYTWMQPQQATHVFDFWRRLSIIIPMAELQWRLESEFWTPIEDFLSRG